jgi:hypothetical protein
VVGGAVRRRWPLWFALACIASLLLCSTPLVVGAIAYHQVAAGPPTAVPSPRAGEPPAATVAWLRTRLDEVLAAQAVALLRGDEAGYLRRVDGAATAVATREYANLRALGLGRWEPGVFDGPTRQADGTWRATVRVDYCFGAADCPTLPIRFVTTWADRPGGVELVGLETSPAVDGGPRPWESDALSTEAGSRVLVAASADLRGALPSVVAEADAAAAVADRYAIGGTPARYVVFYAGETQWKRWYGGRRPLWTGGYATPSGFPRLGVVVNASAPGRTLLDDLLRHELTHAASMPGDPEHDDDVWWLIEGLAELAANGGTPVARYEGLPEVANAVRRTGWNGPLSAVHVARDASQAEVSAAYGVGFLAVRHLAERFGERDLLAFYAAVVVDREPVDKASRRAFGTPWSALHDECVAAVRAAAA